MNKFMFALLCLGCSFLQADSGSDTSHTLFNLKDKPTAPRFALSPERVWPEEPGIPQVCLWSGDRYAAVSITIDDNWAPNHQWWLDITKELDLRVTWFIITDRVDSNSQWGYWDGFRKLVAAGHSVQSHSASHLNLDAGDWQGIEWEYSSSKKTLETQIPGQAVLALAYPGGKNQELNDRDLAAKYYITARGTVGTPNKANQIDYLQTNSARITRPYVDSILEGSSEINWLSGGQYRRAWLSAHFHGLNQEQQASAAEDLRYLTSRKEDLWIAPFAEVAQYGQQRDTHSIEVLENTREQIRFNLTDRMQDEFYNLPLTVKIKLPGDWTDIKAQQGEELLRAETVVHEGAKYALVPVIPDRGEVLLTPPAP